MKSKEFCDWLRGMLDGASLISEDRHAEVLDLIDQKLKEVSDVSDVKTDPIDWLKPRDPYIRPISPSIPPQFPWQTPWQIPTGPTCVSSPYSSMEEFYNNFCTWVHKQPDE